MSSIFSNADFTERCFLCAAVLGAIVLVAAGVWVIVSA
jgi:hypothetical protein